MKRVRSVVAIVVLIMFATSQAGYCCASFGPAGSGMAAPPASSTGGWTSRPPSSNGWGWGHYSWHHNKHHKHHKHNKSDSADTEATKSDSTDTTITDTTAPDTTAPDTTTPDTTASDTTTPDTTATNTTTADTSSTDPAAASTDTTTADPDAASTDDAADTVAASSGENIAIDALDVEGLTINWLNALGVKKDTHTAKVEKDADGKIAFVSIFDKEGALLYRYDANSRLMEHYETSGEAKGKIKYVTSESAKKYTWRDTNAQDPGMGADKHVIVQKYNYDAEGNVESIEYYALTAGNRNKTEDQKKYSRYMYRKDTFEDGEIADTEYFDDPRPTFWEPTVTGTVIKDEQGRLFLKSNEDGKLYLLTARKDGFDADGDGKAGAEEMSGVDWESYVGKEITVRGHQVQDENESDIYCNNIRAEMFGVVDVVEKDEKFTDGWDKISDKVTEAMNKVFVEIGDEKDIDKVYGKIYDKLLKELEKAGVSDKDIRTFADSDMKAKVPAGTGTDPGTDPGTQPGTDPGTDPGTQPGTDPGTDPGTPPGTDPGTDIVIDFTQYTDSKSLIAKAWTFSINKNYDKARAFALETIKRYETEALSQQASLSGFAEAGKEADYWALNDVATAYFIIGKSYRDQNNTAKALTNYQKIVDSFGYAQAWDSQGWWWKVKEAAQEEIDNLS